MACVRAFMAEVRAIFRQRMASTGPSADFGAAVASPAWTERAAASASTVSDLPLCRRALRSGRTTSRTTWPGFPQEAVQPGPVGAGPLDAPRLDVAKAGRPFQQPAV